jgi:transposase
MRFVPIKSDDQLDLQSLHRVRERWVMRRTAVINQIRGLLLERGITLRQGRRHIDAALPGILEDASAQGARLPPRSPQRQCNRSCSSFTYGLTYCAGISRTS